MTQNVTTVVMTVSITHLGDGQQPLVAERILVDGQPVDLPLFVLVGSDKDPLLVSKIGASSAPLFANVLLGAASQLYEGAIARLQPQPTAPDAPVDQPQGKPSDAEVAKIFDDLNSYTGL